MIGRGGGINHWLSGPFLCPLPNPCGVHQHFQVTLCRRCRPRCPCPIGVRAVVTHGRKRVMVLILMKEGKRIGVNLPDLEEEDEEEE